MCPPAKTRTWRKPLRKVRRSATLRSVTSLSSCRKGSTFKLRNSLQRTSRSNRSRWTKERPIVSSRPQSQQTSSYKKGLLSPRRALKFLRARTTALVSSSSLISAASDSALTLQASQQLRQQGLLNVFQSKRMLRWLTSKMMGSS